MGIGAWQVIKQWSSGKQIQTFQWVAIDAEHWIIGNVWLAQIFSTHHFLSIQWHNEFVTATLPGEKTVFVFKSMLEGEQDAAWQQLRQIVPL